MYEDLNSDQISLNPDSVRSFTEKLRGKSGTELLKIITRYISYKPETVEAALIVSVDQGLISYGLKVLLSKQMMTNFIAHSKHIKATRWESNNAFLGFVTRYTDDEIYDFIENPSGIVMDVYHAILMTAKERELISEYHFKEYYKKAMLGTRTDEEIELGERIDRIKEFAFRKPKSPAQAGSLLIASGAGFIMLGIVEREWFDFPFSGYFFIGAGIIAIIASFVIFIIGFFDKKNKN
jgi:hypothetical protein